MMERTPAEIRGGRPGGGGKGNWGMEEKWPKDSFWHDKWQGLKADPDNLEPRGKSGKLERFLRHLACSGSAEGERVGEGGRYSSHNVLRCISK